jgi:predicted nucleotidyltransferase component of viral defense system
MQYQEALKEEADHKSAWMVIRKAITDLPVRCFSASCLSVPHELRLQNKEKEAFDKVRKAKSDRDALQEEANSERPLTVASIEEAKAVSIAFYAIRILAADEYNANQDTEKDLESVKNQFAAAMKKRMDVDSLQVPLLQQLNEIKAQINDFEGQRVAISVSLNGFDLHYGSH